MYSWIFEALRWLGAGLRWWRERRYGVRARLTLEWMGPKLYFGGAEIEQRRVVRLEVEAGREFEHILAGGEVEAKRPLRLRWTSLGDLSDLGNHQLPVSIPPNEKKAVEIGGARLAKLAREVLEGEDEILLRIVARDHRDGTVTSPVLGVALSELEEERTV